MARIPIGREVMQCTVDTEVADLLRVKAAMHRMTVGRLIEQMTRNTYSRDAIIEAWIAEPGSQVQRSAPKMATKVSRRSQELPKATAADNETMAKLWAALEAARTAAGWTGGELAKKLGIAAPNIVQWRKKGMVPASQVEAVEKLLQQEA